MPHFISDTIISMLRILVKRNANPVIFDRLLQLQKQFGSKTSTLLEIIRFLSIFPERRYEMIALLRSLHSKTSYSIFTTYLYHKTLVSLLRNSTPQNLFHFNTLENNILVHQSIFWVSRSKRHYLNALKEALIVVHNYIEIRCEIIGLLSRFPFDSTFYQRYAEFLLFACGDYDGHTKCLEISHELKNRRSPIEDPLLHPMLSFTPRIMQFCKVLTNLNNSVKDTHSSATTTTTTTTEDSTSNPTKVASLLTTSKRNIPFFPIVNNILVALFLAFFFGFEKPYESYTSIESESIANQLNVNSEQLAMISANIVISLATFQMPISGNYTKDFQNVALYSYQLLNEWVQLSYISTNISNAINSYSHYLLEHESLICNIIGNTAIYLANIILGEFNDIQNSIMSVNDRIDELNVHVQKQYYIWYFVYIFIGLAVIFCLFYIILLTIQLNYVFKDDEHAIDFLASRERLSLMILERTEDSWQLLSDFITDKMKFGNHSTLNFSSHSNRVSPSSSTTAISLSPQISSSDHHKLKLVQGRTSITFIGKATRLFKPVVDKKQISRSAPQSDNSDNEANIQTTDSEFVIDPVDDVINRTLLVAQCQWLPVLLYLFAPWIIIMAIIALFTIPIKERTNLEIAGAALIRDLGNQINAYLQITKIVFSTLIFNRTSVNDILIYDEYISSASSPVTKMYSKEQCLLLQGVTCTSAAKITYRVLRDPYFSDRDVAVKLFMPTFLYVSKQMLSEIFYSDLIALASITHSADYCFFIAVGLIMLIIIFVAFREQTVLMAGFNSLFHYPEVFIKDNKKKGKKKEENIKDNDENSNDQNGSIVNIPKINIPIIKSSKTNQSIIDSFSNDIFPLSVLVVASVAETDEIYSISENSQIILHKPPQEFISRNFSNTFPILKNERFELREHLMPDKKSKKIFRSYTTKMGHIIKTVMIEETKQGTGKQDQVANKLSYFVPALFAKSFGEDNLATVNYENNITILLQIKSNIAYTVVDKFFSTLNSQVMNYSSISIIKVDGGIVTLSTSSESSPVVAFLFVRDILNDSKVAAKGKPELFAARSIVMFHSDNLSADLKEGLEPYLETKIPNYEKMIKTLYSIGDDNVCFSASFAEGYIDLEAKCDNRIIDMLCMSFESFSSYFSNFL